MLILHNSIASFSQIFREFSSLCVNKFPDYRCNTGWWTDSAKSEMLSSPFLCQILSYSPRIWAAHRCYIWKVSENCFIEKYAFLIELFDLQKCNTQWWCNIGRCMTVRGLLQQKIAKAPHWCWIHWIRLEVLSRWHVQLARPMLGFGLWWVGHPQQPWPWRDKSTTAIIQSINVVPLTAQGASAFVYFPASSTILSSNKKGTSCHIK